MYSLVFSGLLAPSWGFARHACVRLFKIVPDDFSHRGVKTSSTELPLAIALPVPRFESHAKPRHVKPYLG